jgi:hypothetical protein
VAIHHAERHAHARVRRDSSVEERRAEQERRSFESVSIGHDFLKFLRGHRIDFASPARRRQCGADSRLCRALPSV